MRIRSIKAEYWQHSMHEGLSRDASILGAAIQNFADDEGRGDASPAKIKGLVVPCFEMDVAAALQALAGIQFLILYEAEVDGVKRRLFQVTTFLRHQSISHATPSVLPPPPGWVFRLDAKPSGWSLKKGEWRRGRWYRLEKEGLTGDTMSVPDRHAEDSRKTPREVPECSELACSEVDGGVREGSSLARARTGTGTGKDKDREGVRARAGEPAGSSSRHQENDHEQEAVIPTVEEVVGLGERCVPTAAPRGYCEWWHGEMSSKRRWLHKGFLVDVAWELGTWWRKDTAAYQAGTHRACAGGVKKNGGLPAWRRVEELKRAIGEHPANVKSSAYEPRCSRFQKEGLADLERQLAELEGGGEAAGVSRVEQFSTV